MDISVQTVGTWVAEDRSWLGSAHGTEHPATVTLDVSTFTAATHYPNGYIPSGCVLGKITASGMYGPYDDGASDGRQTAVGFLYSATKIPTNGADVGAPMHWHGAIKSAKLPFSGVAGAIDANGKTDLAGRFWIQ